MRPSRTVPLPAAALGRLPALTLGLLALLLLATPLAAAPTPEEVPAFRLRFRVTALGLQPPAADLAVHLRLAAGDTRVTSTGGAWSDWAASAPEKVAHELTLYPNSYNRQWQYRAMASLSGWDPKAGYLGIETETAIGDGPVHAAPGLLFGPQLGLLVWRDADGAVQIDTLAGHGRRVYDATLRAAILPPEQRPRRIHFGGRYIGGDQDLLAWREGVERLTGLGFNAMHPLPPPVVATVREAGIARVWGAVYNPPGYAFNFAADRQTVFTDFVAKQAAGATTAGWTRDDIAFWVTSDEPGWYYPDRYQELNADPLASADFHAYLRERGFSPADFGQVDWAAVRLSGRRDFAPDDLAGRRLYYWSNRFIPWASSRFFAEVTRAYEAELGPDTPVMVNFNNFMGRFYQPGPVGNNARKTSPNAAMGQHDWMEFGRLRGSTCIATEDWFPDAQAAQWSFYAARLRSAAAYHDVGFGALVIPRVSGQTPGGMPQKILALVGSGAKTIKFFTFGPEYNFPGNCYSENAAVFQPLSDAMGLVGKAEDLLYPGKPKPSAVVILTPQSSQLWDLQDQEIASGLLDVTNTHPIRRHMPYMAETWGFYTALQHGGYPADFVDEEGLHDGGLAGKRVLVVTAPELPAESVAGMLAWVAQGGHLILTAGAARADRYGQPLDTVDRLLGITAGELERRPYPTNLVAIPSTPIASLARGPYAPLPLPGKSVVYGPVERLSLNGGGAMRVSHQITVADAPHPARFDVVYGKGLITRYAFYPGTAYALSATGSAGTGGIPTGHDAALLDLTLAPIRQVVPPQDVRLYRTDADGNTGPWTLIEHQALYSETGIAVTLLNWSGEEQRDVVVQVSTYGRPIRRAVLAGSGKALPVSWPRFPGAAGIEVALITVPRLGAVDVVKLYYAK